MYYFYEHEQRGTENDLEDYSRLVGSGCFFTCFALLFFMCFYIRYGLYAGLSASASTLGIFFLYRKANISLDKLRIRISDSAIHIRYPAPTFHCLPWPYRYLHLPLSDVATIRHAEVGEPELRSCLARRNSNIGQGTWQYVLTPDTGPVNTKGVEFILRNGRRIFCRTDDGEALQETWRWLVGEDSTGKAVDSDDTAPPPLQRTVPCPAKPSPPVASNEQVACGSPAPIRNVPRAVKIQALPQSQLPLTATTEETILWEYRWTEKHYGLLALFYFAALCFFLYILFWKTEWLILLTLLGVLMLYAPLHFLMASPRRHIKVTDRALYIDGAPFLRRSITHVERNHPQYRFLPRPLRRRKYDVYAQEISGNEGIQISTSFGKPLWISISKNDELLEILSEVSHENSTGSEAFR